MDSVSKFKKQVSRINRIQGQLNGVKKMLEDEVYCPDIMIQTKAIASALKSLETEILEGHIKTCIKTAIKTGEGEEDKLNELLGIFKTRLK